MSLSPSARRLLASWRTWLGSLPPTVRTLRAMLGTDRLCELDVRDDAVDVDGFISAIAVVVRRHVGPIRVVALDGAGRSLALFSFHAEPS